VSTRFHSRQAVHGNSNKIRENVQGHAACSTKGSNLIEQGRTCSDIFIVILTAKEKRKSGFRRTDSEPSRKGDCLEGFGSADNQREKAVDGN